jgi:arsenite-transporting ATPase
MVNAVVQTLRRVAQMNIVTTPEEFALNETERVVKSMRESGEAMPISGIVLNRAVTQVRASCAWCKPRAARTKSALQVLSKRFPETKVRTGEDFGGPILGATALIAFGRHIFQGAPIGLGSSPPHRAGAPKLTAARWPVASTPLSLTIGKGGVGKTTFSAALAYITRKRDVKTPVEICSTDPAPSLDDVFQQNIGDDFQSVLGDPKFRAAEIDAVAEYRSWADEMRDKLRDTTSVDTGGVHIDLSFERQLFEALLNVVPPGVDEIFGMLRIMAMLGDAAAGLHAATERRVIIDMAPTGHALELLRMPERVLTWSRLLLKTLAAHRTLPFAREIGARLAEISQGVRALRAALQDERRAAIWVVMLAEPLPDRETSRLVASMRDMGLTIRTVVINRVLPADVEASQCERCRRARAWQLATIARVRQQSEAPILAIVEHREPIAGQEGLEALTRSLWQLA